MATLSILGLYKAVSGTIDEISSARRTASRTMVEEISLTSIGIIFTSAP